MYVKSRAISIQMGVENISSWMNKMNGVVPPEIKMFLEKIKKESQEIIEWKE